MKKFFVGILVALLLIGASASPAKTVSSYCSGEVPTEGLLVDVTRTVLNSPDSGENGNFWAKDDYSQRIRIWAVGDDGDDSVYCGQTDDTGTFDALPGEESPGINSPVTLTGEEDGSFSGGTRVIIWGSLDPEPEWATSGDVGTSDFDEETGIGNSTDPNWKDFYFSEYNFDYVDWGWTYTTCDHGTWVNSSSGNSGDIVPESDGTVCTPPTTDVCANIDGDQAGVPDGLHLDASRLNCVAFQLGGPPPPSPATAGQVLGASTLGATGGAEENIFLALFALGSILVGTGVRKLGVPRE